MFKKIDFKKNNLVNKLNGGLSIALAASLTLGLNSFKSTEYKTVTNLLDNTNISEFKPGLYQSWIETYNKVLLNKGECRDSNRHILVNFNGEVLDTIDNKFKKNGSIDSNKTNLEIDLARINLKNSLFSGVDKFVLSGGNIAKYGYPFAFNCGGKIENDLKLGVERILGEADNSKISGSWKDSNVKINGKAISLEKVFDLVNSKNNFNANINVLERLKGQLVIESSGRKDITSSSGATGILQLMPNIRKSCGISKKYENHRIAQIYCGLKNQGFNYNYLKPKIESSLRNLPSSKVSNLVENMTVQAYHAGIGNISKIFGFNGGNSETVDFINNNPTKFSEYSGNDLSQILLFKNFGKNSIGFDSIGYGLESDVALKEINLAKNN